MDADADYAMADPDPPAQLTREPDTAFAVPYHTPYLAPLQYPAWGYSHIPELTTMPTEMHPDDVALHHALLADVNHHHATSPHAKAVDRDRALRRLALAWEDHFLARYPVPFFQMRVADVRAVGGSLSTALPLYEEVLHANLAFDRSDLVRFISIIRNQAQGDAEEQGTLSFLPLLLRLFAPLYPTLTTTGISPQPQPQSQSQSPLPLASLLPTAARRSESLTFFQSWKTARDIEKPFGWPMLPPDAAELRQQWAEAGDGVHQAFRTYAAVQGAHLEGLFILTPQSTMSVCRDGVHPARIVCEPESEMHDEWAIADALQDMENTYAALLPFSEHAELLEQLTPALIRKAHATLMRSSKVRLGPPLPPPLPFFAGASASSGSHGPGSQFHNGSSGSGSGSGSSGSSGAASSHNGRTHAVSAPPPPQVQSQNGRRGAAIHSPAPGAGAGAGVGAGQSGRQTQTITVPIAELSDVLNHTAPSASGTVTGTSIARPRSVDGVPGVAAGVSVGVPPRRVGSTSSLATLGSTANVSVNVSVNGSGPGGGSRLAIAADGGEPDGDVVVHGNANRNGNGSGGAGTASAVHYSNAGVTRGVTQRTAVVRSQQYNLAFCPAGGVDQQLEYICKMGRQYIRNWRNPFSTAAWIHLTIVRCHPFDDGNGRLARLLCSIPLIKHGFPPLALMPEFKTAYYEGMNRAWDGDFSTLIACFFESMRTALVHVERLVDTDYDVVGRRVAINGVPVSVAERDGEDVGMVAS